MGKDDVKVTIIIPVYNSEKHIRECLNSVFEQTYPAFEVIIVNDGSTDRTDQIVQTYLAERDNIVYLTQENHGQGFSRNRALKIVQGDHVLFLDSDDFLEPVTLELCTNRILKDKSDFVNFQWKTYDNKTGAVNYNFLNKRYARSNLLMGTECEKLLTVGAYYTWCNMYKYRFLMTNDIKFGEGYIYEDHIFYAKMCLCAQKVSLIHSPLYNYRLHDEATTKKNLGKRHFEGQLQATVDTFEMICSQGCSEYAKAVIANHAYRSFLNIYSNKTPLKYKRVYLKEFVDLFSPFIFECEDKLRGKLRKLYNAKIFARRKYSKFALRLGLTRFKNALKRNRKALRKSVKRMKNCKRLYYEMQTRKPILANCILFLGFSWDYKGNSKYLYNQMKELYPHMECRFVTSSCEVDASERIKRNSLEYYYYLARSKVIIAETWLPYNIQKRKEQILVQTWHATTVKKLLFDTAEPHTTAKNYRQKIKKYKGIQLWDYFLTDNEFIKKYYRTSFLLKKEQIVAYGYPRVKFLIDNRSNNELKATIKKRLNIPRGRKIVLYAPTWRDYNYRKKDYDYLLDLDHLMHILGDDYVILFKDHDHIKKTDDLKGSFVNVNNFDTQELILIADFVISDYSSIVFDAMAIDIPILIYANDKDLYDKARGVYPEIFSDLLHWATKNEIDLARKIVNYKIDEYYCSAKDKYCLKRENYCLPEFLGRLASG